MKKIRILSLIIFFSFLFGQMDSYLYKVIVPKNGINIRTGPGTNFPIEASGQLVKSETLYVISEENGWLKFRVTEKNIGWHGWVLKKLVVNNNSETVDRGIVKELTDLGFLKKFDIDLNEAWVDFRLWNSLDYNEKLTLAKGLGEICAKSGSTGRLTVLDNNTGKKLAKYSQVYGFKVY